MPEREADLVSVVIPTRNRRERLERALASVLSQTWSRLEVIVVDDASNDGTDALVLAWAVRDARVRLVRNDRPLGGGGARNAGIAHANGRYIAFLDDDDEWLPRKLEIQCGMLAAHPDASAASSSFILSLPGTADRTLQMRPLPDRQALLRDNCLGGASVCCATRHHLTQASGFDPALPSGQDWDLWLKLQALGPVLVCADPLVRHIVHKGERITGNPRSAYRGRRRIHLRYQSEMTPATRRHSLCEIAFFRRVVCRGTWLARFSGLCWVVAVARGKDRLRYPYRLLREALSGGAQFPAR